MKKTSLTLGAIALLTAFTTNVDAAIGSISISGTTLNAGETKSLSIRVSGGLMSADGDVSSNDPSCIQVTSGSYFRKIDVDGNAIGPNIASVGIKALKPGCSTTLKISNASLNTVDGVEERSLNFTSGTITVKAEEQVQPSQPTNNNNNNNNNNNTSSNTNSSSGKVAVTTTTQTTETKKDGSSNNLLSSLSVNGYSLDKRFNANTTNYSMSVDKDVKSITVNATAADSKAKVTIYGTNSLKGGKNTVSIVVVAENGSKKTYSITVNKEKDPNEVEDNTEENQEEQIELSSINTLENIEINTGLMSPAFNKDVNKYIIYVPFDVEQIEINPILTDEKATVDMTKLDKLKLGSNKVTITVTAENGETNKYVLIIKRGINPEFAENDNTYLKSLKIKNGKLITDFDKKTLVYYYSGKNINIDAIAEDENAIVDISKEGDTYYVKVEAPNGNYRIYTLKPYKFYTSLWFETAIFILGFASGYIFRIVYKKWRKKASKKKALKSLK